MRFAIRGGLPAVLVTLALGAAPATAGASISEFTGLTAGAPGQITSGPDGALWFAEDGGIGRLSMDGTLTEYPAGLTPGFAAGAQPADLVAGRDGAIWFTERGGAGALGRLDLATQKVTEYTAGLTAGAQPTAITVGRDGNLWFTEPGVDAIGRVGPDGTITEFTDGITTGARPTDIVADRDGILWFTEEADPGRLGRLDPATGAVSEFPAGSTPNGAPRAITAGDDGKLYFAQPALSRITRAKPNGLLTPSFDDYTDGMSAGAQPADLAHGGDGALWFTEAGSPGRLGRLSGGMVTEYTGGLAAGFTGGNDPAGITRGPDGNVWFTQRGLLPRIARVTVPPKAGVGFPRPAPDGRVTLRGDVAPNSQQTTYFFEVTQDTGYERRTAEASAGAGAEEQDVSADLDLPREAGYRVRVTATNASGFAVSSEKAFYLTAAGEILGERPDVKVPGVSTVIVDAQAPAGAGDSTSAELLPPAEPVLGRSVAVAPVEGAVRVKPPGAPAFVPLRAGASIRVGSLVDTRRGTVALRSARGAGRTQTGRFWGAIFAVRQSRGARGMTDLVLRGGRFAACPSAVTARASSVIGGTSPRRVVRRLWGRDHGGRFRTHGRDAVASVRGTVWATTDRCDGTRTRVKQGQVLVRDLRTGRKVLLRAGQSYLARHRR